MEAIQSKKLAFTITSGRSGTALLTALANCIPGVKAVHEAPPRMNFVLRAACVHSRAASFWLQTEMYPAIGHYLHDMDQVYFETSHLFCKGFIEPTLEMGLRPKFVILRRAADQVAASLYAIGCVPERTEDGRLVLLGPNDRGVQPMEGWEQMTDYQLCYWYALEIERRQAHYLTWLPSQGCEVLSLDFKQILVPQTISKLADFLLGDQQVEIDMDLIASVLSENQNPRERHSGNFRSKAVPHPPMGVDKLKLEDQVKSFFK